MASGIYDKSPLNGVMINLKHDYRDGRTPVAQQVVTFTAPGEREPFLELPYKFYSQYDTLFLQAIQKAYEAGYERGGRVKPTCFKCGSEELAFIDYGEGWGVETCCKCGLRQVKVSLGNVFYTPEQVMDHIERAGLEGGGS